MTCNDCGCRRDCTFLAVIASIIIGVVTAFLRFAAVITVTPAFLWVLFGIAIVYLALTPIALALIRGYGTKCCVCRVLPTLLTGILGTILTSVILLGITFVATSIVGAIITGLLLLFFTLTVVSVACLATCAARCTDRNAE